MSPISRADGYTGRDAEIRYYKHGAVFRGPIEFAMTDADCTLTIHFKWLAKNDGSPRQMATTWTRADQPPEFKANLMTFTREKDAPPGWERHNSPIHGVILIIHPPGDNLDPSRVAGLTAA